jgi:ubiquinone/menaquinone biosynthesis C-methylase UbiE
MKFDQENISEAWWESEGGFFGPLYLEADDSLEGFLYNPQDMADRIQTEVNGIIKLCALKQDDAVLDCPSGYGRHSIALAQKGFCVTGVDINDYFLKVAREKIKKFSIGNCRFLKEDMRMLRFTDAFDAVINMFYSFGFFSKEKDDMQVVENFHHALKPGGKFLMHTHITLPKIMSGDYKRHEIRTLQSGSKLELFRDYDPVMKRENGQWFILHPDGTKEDSEPYSMRIYSIEEFTALCRQAGFSRVDAYGDWAGSPYKDSSSLLIAVATK